MWSTVHYNFYLNSNQIDSWCWLTVTRSSSKTKWLTCCFRCLLKFYSNFGQFRRNLVLWYFWLVCERTNGQANSSETRCKDRNLIQVKWTFSRKRELNCWKRFSVLVSWLVISLGREQVSLHDWPPVWLVWIWPNK